MLDGENWINRSFISPFGMLALSFHSRKKDFLVGNILVGPLEVNKLEKFNDDILILPSHCLLLEGEVDYSPWIILSLIF